MSQTPQIWNKRDENADPITTKQPYGSTGTSTSAGVARDENGPTIKHQPDAPSAGKGMSTGLSRALVGGLIGVTLGTLAGALANKRTAKGVNHAAKGVGQGAKSVAEGVNHAAKGVGDAVKSVAEGVNYAVVGGLADAVKDISENAEKSVVGAVDALKGAAEDVNPFDNQKVAGNKQVTTGEVGIGEQFETQTADISVPVEEEVLVVVQAIPVDAGTALTPNEADFYQGEVARTEVDEQATDTTTAYPLQ